MALENTDNLFHVLLEKTAEKMREEAIPADQPGGPSITPDVSDLTPPAPKGPSTPGPDPQGGQPPYPHGGMHGGRPPMDGMGVPPLGHGPLYIPYPAYSYPTTYYDAAPRSRVTKRGKLQDPESCDTFEEQVQVISDNIRSYIISGRYKQAAKYVSEWYDGVIDEDSNKLHPVTRNMLNDLSKNNLVAFVEALIRNLD